MPIMLSTTKYIYHLPTKTWCDTVGFSIGNLSAYNWAKAQNCPAPATISCTGISMTIEHPSLVQWGGTQPQTAVPWDRAPLSILFDSAASLSADRDTTESHSAQRQSHNLEMISPTQHGPGKYLFTAKYLILKKCAA